MMNPMNAKQLVDLHTEDLERLAEPSGWTPTARRARMTLRRVAVRVGPAR